jgi:chromosome segregation ATPase
MKTYLLLTSCFILAGCGRDTEQHQELLSELKAIKSELASKQGAPVRWAFANKREIDSAIFKWTREKMEEVKRAEALPPDMEEKVRQYEALQSELLRRQMETKGFRLPPRIGAGPAQAQATDKDLDALAERVKEAKAPVADIVERRNRQAAQFREQYPIERLVSEYAKEHYDLVVDSNERVLYRSGADVPEITEGVIAYFREKTKH